MKIKFLYAAIITSTLLAAFSCSKVKMTEAEKEREQWLSSFSDSITYYQQKSSDIENRLASLNGDINRLMGDFEKINNPREVTGYYLMKGWSSKLPLTSTGIYARINENEKLELIATLAGATFNKLGVGTSGSEFLTETVPHDQAFNYRHERYNTVYFSGGKADTVAQYINLHLNDKINLQFIEGAKKVNFVLPDSEKQMIAKTWQLYSQQNETKKLQKELWICSRKIDTFRRMTYMEE